MNLAEISDIAQIFIASCNLILAGYLLIYQKRKDNKVENETAKLNEQNIKLQWFKELIVQPNILSITDFYNKLQSIKEKITSNELTIEQKEDINNFVKAELVIFRKSFVDVLFSIDRQFATNLLTNLDSLIDNITNSIFNDELKLLNSNVYEKNIGSKILHSKSNLISQLYNYKGISDN